MVWIGKDLKDHLFTALPTMPSWLWTLPGMEQPQIPWKIHPRPHLPQGKSHFLNLISKLRRFFQFHPAHGLGKSKIQVLATAGMFQEWDLAPRTPIPPRNVVESGAGAAGATLIPSIKASPKNSWSSCKALDQKYPFKYP